LWSNFVVSQLLRDFYRFSVQSWEFLIKSWQFWKWKVESLINSTSTSRKVRLNFVTSTTDAQIGTDDHVSNVYTLGNNKQPET